MPFPPKPALRRTPSGYFSFLIGCALAAASLCCAPQAGAQASPAVLDVNVRDHGAIGDGSALDTAALQRAIDTCAERGGGRVTVPAGTYLTGTVLIKGGVRLHLAKGATLLGSVTIADYRNVDVFRDGTGAELGYAMVAAVDAENVALEGEGVIDGRGKQLLETLPRNERFKRPLLVRFVRCRNVTVRGVQLKSSAAWTANFFQSSDVTIDQVKIESRGVSNNDGIDLDSCERVAITACDIDTGDDSICLKTTSGKPTRRISISGCRLKSNHGAIKFGTESRSNFEDITIARCDIRETRNGGIKLLSVDGGRIRNVTISDLTMDDVSMPIFIRLGARLKTFREGDQKQPVGGIENVTIRNVKAKASPTVGLMPPSGVFITGIPGHRIENLRLQNISIELAGGGQREHGRQVMEENIDSYPEINRFGPRLPAHGIYARHVKGLHVSDFTLKLASADLRPALVCIDVEQAEFAGWKTTAKAGGESLVRLEQTKDVSFAKFTVAGDVIPFLRVEGSESSGISVAGVPDAAKSVEFGAGAGPAALREK